MFETIDLHGRDIFNYAVRGLASAENSCLSPELKVISVIFEKFKKVIENQPEKNQLLRNKVENIKSLLSEEDYEHNFVEEYTEQLLIDNK